MKGTIIKIIILLLSVNLFAQSYSGKITDTLFKPLPFVNIIATDVNQVEKTVFSITDDNGNFSLDLLDEVSYRIQISSIGYHTKEIVLPSKRKSTNQDFILEEKLESLQEVKINYKYQPITVKQDTLIYNTDSFRDGTEQKVRDLLKNLPGIEVDRDGNVFSNGKRITHVLVDGKMFFTGDSKLAVNNIPADAADKIEIIDDYHQIAMFKGLEQSDDMAMNIVLKEDKKKFV